MTEPGIGVATDDLGIVEGAVRDARALFRDRTLMYMHEQEALFERLITEVKCNGCQNDDIKKSGSCETAAAAIGHQVGCRPSMIASLPSTVKIALDEKVEQQAFYAANTCKKLAHATMFERIQGATDSLFADRDESGAGMRCIRRALTFAGRMFELREPQRQGRLAEFVASKRFGALCVVCIALNAVFLIYSADYEMANPNREVTYVMTILERTFVGFYVVELLLKLSVHRLFFFWCEDASWNILDLCLVCLSLFEMAVVYMAREGVRGINYSFMRCLRMFKLAKVLRVVRSVRFFTELRLMFDCVLGSMLSMIWCLAMILFIVYIFGLLMVQGLAQDLSSPDCPYSLEEQIELRRFFGSVGHSMLTLIKSTTGGHDWGEFYEMFASGSGILAWSYLAYIIFFSLAVWNIVTGLFVEKALKLAQPDIDTIAMERNMQDSVDAQELTSMFNLVDADGSGRISLDELRSMMHHPKFRTYLRVRGIEVTDAQLFHGMLLSVAGSEDPDIDISFIVSACLRMKGSATSMDLHALSFESRLISRRLQRYIGENSMRLHRIEESIESLAKAVGIADALATRLADAEPVNV